MKSSPHSPQLEKARVQRRRPSAAKKYIIINKLINFFKKRGNRIEKCEEWWSLKDSQAVVCKLEHGNGKTPFSTCVFLLCVFPLLLTQDTSFLILWSPNVWRVFSTTTSKSSWHHLVSYNLTQLWHYLPRDGIRFHRVRALVLQDSVSCPTPLPPTHTHFRCQLQAQVVTWASDQPAVDWRFQPHPPWVWLIC